MEHTEARGLEKGQTLTLEPRATGKPTKQTLHTGPKKELTSVSDTKKTTRGEPWKIVGTSTEGAGPRRPGQPGLWGWAEMQDRPPGQQTPGGGTHKQGVKAQKNPALAFQESLLWDSGAGCLCNGAANRSQEACLGERRRRPGLLCGTIRQASLVGSHAIPPPPRTHPCSRLEVTTLGFWSPLPCLGPEDARDSGKE